MIVLDTNVLSELMRSDCNLRVLNWLAGFHAADIVTTVISQAEIMSGLAVLPQGRRRSALEEAASAMFQEDFESRILPFDGKAVPHYADLIASRRRSARPISTFDAAIAAISMAHGAGLATRNVRDFRDSGLDIYDPWNS